MILNSLKKWRRAIICVLLLEMSLTASTQGLKIKEIKQVMSDLSASIHQRDDSTGMPCGLIKVLAGNSNLDFGDNVVGNVENKTNEYWVYLPKGSKVLVIKRQNYLPMTVRFSDYGIEEIDSKVTYQLVLKEVSFNTEKNSVIINVTPKNAQLKIDGVLVENRDDGSYRMFLEKGEHAVKLEALGYRTGIEVVKTGKGLQTKDISLESLMARVKIDCQTNTAMIYANDKKLGTGSWEGDLVAGDYTIEARLEGFKTEMQSVTLLEKDVKEFYLPQLEREIIQLSINTSPSYCYERNVYIDGKIVGHDSIVSHSILYGKHLVKVEITGCGTIEESIDATHDTKTISYSLKPSDNTYASAYQGDLEACLNLGSQKLRSYSPKDSLEARFWYDFFLKNIEEKDYPILIKRKKETTDMLNLYAKLKKSAIVEKIVGILQESMQNCNDKEDINWDVFDTQNSIAVAYWYLEEYEKSIRWFEKMIPDAKKCTIYDYTNAYTVWRNIFLCYKNIGDLDNALKSLFNGLNAYPVKKDDGSGLTAMGKEDGDYATMYLYLEEDIADVYYEKGNVNEAIKWYRKYYKDSGWDKEDNRTGNTVDLFKKLKKMGLYEQVVGNM